MSDSFRRQRARLGALALHASHDPKQTTQPGRAAFMLSFERLVDPRAELPEAERQRRASYALKLHMGRLALKSAAARRAKRRPTTTSSPPTTTDQVARR